MGHQGLANYSQHTNCGPKIISESQVWLEYSHALCLGTVCGCSHATLAEQSGCDGNHMATKPRLFTLRPFTEKFAEPCNTGIK